MHAKSQVTKNESILLGKQPRIAYGGGEFALAKTQQQRDLDVLNAHGGG